MRGTRQVAPSPGCGGAGTPGEAPGPLLPEIQLCRGSLHVAGNKVLWGKKFVLKMDKMLGLQQGRAALRQ